MKEQTEEYVEIDLIRLASALWHRAWAVLLVALLSGAAAFCCAFFLITPRYQSSALMYVNNGASSIDSSSVSPSDLSASQSLVDTYIVILKTRLTLNEVIRQAGLAYTYEELYDMVHAQAVNSTEILQIVVTSEDPQEAERIANTIVNVLPEKISEVMDGSSVRTVDFAVLPTESSFPNYVLFTVVGLLLGIAMSCGVIFFKEFFDEKIRNEEYIIQAYRLPILASIPNMLVVSDKKQYRKYGKYYRGGPAQAGDAALYGKGLDFTAAEAYKLLRTNITFALPDESGCRMVGVTSACRGEGKSTTALNLAYMLAEAGEQVLLLEADMRMPSLSRRLGCKAAPGFSNVLAGMNGVWEAVQDSGIHKNLRMLASGDIPPNPSELLASKAMQPTLSALSENFSYIIMDLPPVSDVSDALAVSNLIHGMVVTVRQDATDRRVLTKAMRNLEHLHVKILGIVMTFVNSRS